MSLEACTLVAIFGFVIGYLVGKRKAFSIVEKIIDKHSNNGRYQPTEEPNPKEDK